MDQNQTFPRLDIAIQGADIDIKRDGILLNGLGDGRSRYRFRGENGLLKEWCVETLVSSEGLSFEIHTWNEEGHHLDLVEGERLQTGDAFEKEVDVILQGKKTHLAFRLFFHVD